jgi:diguanylate cyclase (GGDEF)-like protein/PAS domain S-box-containing protein
MTESPFIAFYSFTIPVAAAFFYVAWRRRNTPSALPLALMMLAAIEWALAGIFVVASESDPSRIFWFKLEVIGILTAPVFFLVFALEHNRREKWLTPRRAALLFIIPTLSAGLTFTNELHNLILSGLSTGSGVDKAPIFRFGIGFWLGVSGYGILMMFAGALLLLQDAIRFPRIFRRRSILLLGAALAPWIGILLYSSNRDSFPALDPILASIILSAIVSVIASLGLGGTASIRAARDLCIETMPDGMLLLDEENRIVDINPAAARMFGRTAREHSGEKIDRILPVWNDWERLLKNHEKTRVVPFPFEGEGSLELLITPLKDPGGYGQGRLFLLRNITERTRSEEEIEQAKEKLKKQLTEIQVLKYQLQDTSLRDPLTGLYNRSYFTETLDRELARAARIKDPVSVVILEPDRFKDISEVHGRKAGEELLKLLGDFLRRQIRRADAACRFSDDAFALVMPSAPLASTVQRIEAMRKAFTTIHLNYLGEIIQTTFSAGVAGYPENGGNADTILDAAEKALVELKGTGGNAVRTG